MAAKGTQYQLPLVAKLVKNREDQQAADAQKNFEERDGGLHLQRQPTDGVEFGTVMEWVGVFFRVFSLSLVSGSFLLAWVFALKLAGY